MYIIGSEGVFIQLWVYNCKYIASPIKMNMFITFVILTWFKFYSE